MRFNFAKMKPCLKPVVFICCKLNVTIYEDVNQKVALERVKTGLAGGTIIQSRHWLHTKVLGQTEFCSKNKTKQKLKVPASSE